MNSRTAPYDSAWAASIRKRKWITWQSASREWCAICGISLRRGLPKTCYNFSSNLFVKIQDNNLYAEAQDPEGCVQAVQETRPRQNRPQSRFCPPYPDLEVAQAEKKAAQR